MSTGNPPPSAAPAPSSPQRGPTALVIYSHSMFFYWWPVWVVGYIMALLTWLKHEEVTIGVHKCLIHPSKDLGVIYTFVFFLVIVLTNIPLRGMYSAIIILVALLGILGAAYFDLWETFLGWLGDLNIYMNMGFYVFFSTLVLIMWAGTVFISDRFTYWRVTPGQITQLYLVGGGSKSFDTRGILFEKVRQDLFRHWILGFGSGDLRITLAGAGKQTVEVPNVLFVGTKVRQIQELIATSPS
jgi:hypothetical protein